MSRLLQRLRKLESQLKNSPGRLPYTREERDYWCSQVNRLLNGEEDVDVSGMTREMTDDILEDYHKELDAKKKQGAAALRTPDQLLNRDDQTKALATLGNIGRANDAGR